MNAPTLQVHKPVDAVLALAASQLDAERLKQVQAVAPEYFRRIDEQDLAERTPEDLLAALLMHLWLGATRERDQPKVRIFSPTAAEGGWNSRHSVIQIVNDDMPFLVDSTTLEINRQGLTLHLIVHPIFAVERDASRQLRDIVPRAQSEKAPRESWMHIEIDRLIDEEQREALEAGITRVLADVRHSVRDWRPMLARLEIAIAELANPPATVPDAAVSEARAFLQWLADDHMTLLGYRQHDLVREGGEVALRLVAGSGLGVLREKAQEQLSASFSALGA
jgi:glutamate dehydrogenase